MVRKVKSKSMRQLNQRILSFKEEMELLPNEVVLGVIEVAIAICKRVGYQVSEIEYESAINLAVLRALRDWQPDSGKSLVSFSVMYATRACSHVESIFNEWQRQDRAGALRGREQATPTPIPLTDFELLSFVAAHGRLKAAKMLAMSAGQLRNRLDEVELRVRSRQ